MCCSIILVFLALGSPEPLQAQENQKERITIQVKNQPIQKVFDDLSSDLVQYAVDGSVFEL